MIFFLNIASLLLNFLIRKPPALSEKSKLNHLLRKVCSAILFSYLQSTFFSICPIFLATVKTIRWPKSKTAQTSSKGQISNDDLFLFADGFDSPKIVFEGFLESWMTSCLKKSDVNLIFWAHLAILNRGIP